MKSLLVLTTITTILFIVIILKLLKKIHILTKVNKYANQAEMWHKLAITDDLTGVYNRNAYNLHLEKIRNSYKNELLTIMLFDVDNFKKINDTKGHLEGDKVLKDVAKTLLETYSGYQYKVFRIGGDEFLVLARGVYEKEIIKSLNLLEKRFETIGNIRLSKGYSIIENNPEDAFKYADEMLYADKLSKKEWRILN